MKKANLIWKPLEEVNLKHCKLYMLCLKKDEEYFYDPFTAYWNNHEKIFCGSMTESSFSEEIDISFDGLFICENWNLPNV